MNHIRAIVSDQACLTGQTHQEIMEQYGVQSALQMISYAHSRELSHQNPQDWMLQLEWDQAIGECLHQAELSTEPVSDTEREIWACPVCDEQFVSAAALKVHARRKHNITEQAENIFDRRKHSIGGLPQCSGCLKKFSRWQTLRQHINNHSCPGRAPNVLLHTVETHMAVASMSPHGANSNNALPDCLRTESTEQVRNSEGTECVEDDREQTESRGVPGTATESSGNMHVHTSLPPLIQQHTVQQLVEEGLNAFIGNIALQASMLQHCVVCGQWVASQKVMKRHSQHSHSTLYQQLQQAVQRLIAQKATPCSTCHYCGRRHKDWKAHLYKCITPWQCAFMCAYRHVYVQHGRRDGGILWVGTVVPDNGRRHEGGHGNGATDVTADTQSIHVVREHTEQAPARPSHRTETSSTLLPIPTIKEPRQRSIDVFLSLASSQTTRRATHSATGHGFCTIPETRTGVGHASPLSNSISLQGPVGGGTAMAAGAAATENGTGDGSLQRANRPAQWHSGEPGKAEASYGSGMAGRKGMEVPSVEQTIETPGNRQSASTDPRLPNVGSSGYHPSVPTSSHCHEVLLHETHDGNNELPSHLQIGLVSSEPQRDHYVGHAQDGSPAEQKIMDMLYESMAAGAEQGHTHYL